MRFQPPLSGALHVERTNAFFLGGGKALINAFYRGGEAAGIDIRYNTPIDKIEMEGGQFVAVHSGLQRFTGRAAVLAAGGFKSHRE